MGIEDYTLWSSVSNNSNTQFKWYGGNTTAMTLSGSGNLSVTGSLTCDSSQITNNCTVGGNLSVTGNITSTGAPIQQTLTNASTASGETAFICKYNKNY